MSKRLRKTIVGDGTPGKMNAFKEQHKVDRSKFDISKFYRVSVGHKGSSQAYKDGWDKIFGKKKRKNAKSKTAT